MRLEQKLSITGGKLTLSVENNDVLVITHKKLMNSSSSRYLLDDIDPRYHSFQEFSLAATLISLICFVFSICIGWYGKTHYSPPDDGAFLFFSFITFIGAIISGVKAVNSRANVISFNNARNGYRLFSIFGNKPSQEEVEKFCSDLCKTIESIRYSEELSNKKMSDVLTRHVEFLSEQKVLSDDEVRAALMRIENRMRPNVVNFKSN